MLSLLEEEELNDRKSQKDAAKAFTQAMQACGRAQRWREAVAVLERMKAAGVEPDAFAYNAALSACARSNQIEAMLKVLREMKATGVSPDTVSYTIAIDGCARAGLTSQALRLFHSMGKGSAPPPDAVCYGAAIAACARPTTSSDSAWEDALRILKAMTEPSGPGPTIQAVSGAMAACSNARKYSAALGLFARLGDFGLYPDGIVCSTAIAAHSRSGQYGEALRLFRAMRSTYGIRRDAVCYNTLLHAPNPGTVDLDMRQIGLWVRVAVASGLIRGYFDVDERLIIGLGDEARQSIERESHAAILW